MLLTPSAAQRPSNTDKDWRNFFVDDEVVTDSEGSDDDDVTTEAQLIPYQNDILLRPAHGQVEPAARAAALIRLWSEASDSLVASIAYVNARRALETLSAEPVESQKLFALSDNELSSLILEAFIAGTIKAALNSDSDDADKWEYDVASRVHDVIETLNKTRAARPALGVAPYHLVMALSLLPDSPHGQGVRDFIDNTMRELFQDSDSNGSTADEMSDGTDAEDDEEVAASDIESEDAVAHIVASRKRGSRDVEYLVRWTGTESGPVEGLDTWKTALELGDMADIVDDYMLSLRRKRRRKFSIEDGSEEENV